MTFISNDSIIVNRRKGTQDDEYVSIQETILIKESKVILKEIPYQFDGVTVTGANKTWYEVKGASVPTGNQYRVDYTFGIIEFDPSANGLSPDFAYTGTGETYFPASRVWTETDGVNVTKTLADIITAGETAITNLEQVQQITQDAIDATDNANNALTIANTLVSDVQNAETSRTDAENTRQTNETTRQNQESTRQTQEQSRVTAEQGRVNAETSRVNAEQDRSSSESTRVSQEGTRQTQESTRQSNETTRQTNETARQTAISNLAAQTNNWNNTTAYKARNIVRYGKATYIALVDNTGFQPDQNVGTKWQIVAQDGADGTGQGTVTNVSSANTDISVTNGTTTPTLTANSGTGANQLLKLNANAQAPISIIPDNGIVISKLADKPMYSLPNILDLNKGSFSRASNAYDIGGNLLPYNVMRTVRGKYGHGVLIEELTSNIFAVNPSNAETDISGFSTNNTGTTLTRDATTSYEGSASIKVVCDGTVANQGFFVSFTASPNTTYTFSAYVKGTGTLDIRFSAAVFTSMTPTTFTPLSNGWTRYSVTATSNATGGSTSASIITSGAAQNVTYWVDALQLEQKSYPTSYITGGQTRQADSFVYTMNTTIPIKNSGYIIWKPDQDSNATNGNNIRSIVYVTNKAQNSWRYSIHYKYDSKTFRFQKSPDNGTTVYNCDSSAITFSAKDSISIAWEDDPISGVMILWVSVNGGTVQKFSLNNSVQITDAQSVFIGCRNSTGYECNGVIDFPIISDVLPSDEQVQALFQSSEVGGLRDYPMINTRTPNVQSFSGGYRKHEGSSSATVATAGTSVTVTITFPTPFLSVPTVYPVLTTVSVGDAGYINVRTSSVSTTSVTINVNSYVAQTVGFNWFAFGN